MAGSGPDIVGGPPFWGQFSAIQWVLVACWLEVLATFK